MILILYFGHTGTTEKAANILKENIKDSIVMNGNKIKKIDFSTFDHIIFGINVRMGKLNKSFMKFYKRFSKKETTVPVSAYVIAADLHQAPVYMNLATTLLPEDSYVGYFGGEFNLVNAKGITKHVLKSCIQKFKEQDLPLPELIPSAIKDFALHILDYIEVHN